MIHRGRKMMMMANVFSRANHDLYPEIIKQTYIAEVRVKHLFLLNHLKEAACDHKRRQVRFLSAVVVEEPAEDEVERGAAYLDCKDQPAKPHLGNHWQLLIPKHFRFVTFVISTPSSFCIVNSHLLNVLELMQRSSFASSSSTSIYCLLKSREGLKNTQKKHFLKEIYNTM